MPLQHWVKNRWEILIYKHSDTRCDFWEYMNSIDKNDNDRLFADIQRLAEEGRSRMPTKKFHNRGCGHEQVINGKKYCMYGLETGRHRLYCILQEEDNIVIFFMGYLKDTKGTDKKNIQQFKNILKRLKDEGEI